MGSTTGEKMYERTLPKTGAAFCRVSTKIEETDETELDLSLTKFFM